MEKSMQKAWRFFNRYASMQAIQEFKDKYCPDGQTCENIAMFGGLAFIAWFMYVAMLPIM